LLINFKDLRRGFAAFAARKYMDDQKDKVPLFKSWTHWYVLVISFIILLIILFYWMTKTFA